jgi:hypothetical protein
MSCWNKQHHDVTAPETPVYALTGFVTDRDNRQPMKSVIVQLTAQTLLYDYDFTEATDTTDANGNYAFQKITPGTYQITAYRQSYPVVQETLVMEHKEKQFEMALPKYLVARRRFAPPGFPSFTGIYWLSPEILAGTAAWKRHSDDPLLNSILKGNFDDGFDRLGSDTQVRENPAFFALTYLERYWTTNGQSPNTTVYSIDPSKGTVEGGTLTAYALRDLTSDKTNLWASADPGKIIKFGVHPSIVEKVYDVEAQQPYGIAWSGTNMWIYDYTENLILMLDEALQVTTSYRPFGWDEENIRFYQLSDLRYLAFDPSGALWASDSISVYEFKLSE